jgi:hypothetical protein
MAEDLLYLGPECHGSELCLEWPMRGRDSDRGSWKIQVRNSRCESDFDDSADRLLSPCWTARVVERSRSQGDSPIPTTVSERVSCL